MSTFLAGQIDYVYFLYGLAFILLGAVCFSWVREGPRHFPWLLLAGFAFAHGAGEWLELVALTGGDTPSFETVRALVFGVSFLALIEFARRSNEALHGRTLGWWLHGAVLGGVASLTLAHGVSSLNASFHLLAGTPASIWAGLLFLSAAASGVPDERTTARGALLSAGLALCTYGALDGLVVPAVPFFPADRVTKETFLAVAGLPVLRGLTAGWLTISVWASAESFDAEGMVRRKRTLAFWLMVAIVAAIQAGGWLFTNTLGSLHEGEIVQDADAEAALLEDRFLLEMRSTDEMARSLASAASRLRLVDGPQGLDRGGLDALVESACPPLGERVAYVLDSNGRRISASSVEQPDGLEGRGEEPPAYFVDAMDGRPGHLLGSGVVGGLPGYLASGAIQGGGGKPVGVVVVKRALSAERLGLQWLPGSFLVSPEGKILLSGRHGAEGKSFWPGAGPSSASSGEAPLLEQKISGTRWVRIDGMRQIAVCRPLPEAGWSIVLLREERTRRANRLLGIVITLLFCTVVMAYFVAMQRQYGAESLLSREHGLLKGLSQQLARRADTDALTGLRNRQAFDAILARQVERARRHGRPLSIVMIDLDHFKEINDAHGHKAGDEILVRTARFLTRNVRRSDTVARWGGEEFMIVSPRTAVEGARWQAEKIRRVLAESASLNLAKVRGVTASFGVASMRREETIEELLRRVDAALYRAKESGRNRVEVEESA